MNLSQIIIRPVLTEKSVRSSASSKYTFVVHKEATKIDVKNALKTLYGVTVEKVNVLEIKPKFRFGKKKVLVQKRDAERKVVVTLKQGETLDINKPAKQSK